MGYTTIGVKQMPNYDFSDATEANIDLKKGYRKELSQSAGSLVANLTVFKGKFDALYTLSTVEEQAILTAKFNTFKLDAKTALGL